MRREGASGKRGVRMGRGVWGGRGASGIHNIPPVIIHYPPPICSGTRETAMVNAFLSAGAAHGIASACHESVLEGCTCDADPARREGDVTYLQSCGDDVNYAIRLLRELYGLEGSTRERDLVDSWNNELGYAVS